MSIFKTYVLRNLRKNIVRTIMTVAGIILSVALVTAVIEGGFSGVEYLRNIIKDTNGNFHGYAVNLTKDETESIVGREDIADYAIFRTKGWAEIGSSNSTKPYLLVKEVSGDIREYAAIKLIEGNYPENENELLISEHLYSNGNVSYKVGDTVTLTLGMRIDSESGLIPETDKHKENEKLVFDENGGIKKTYTVCGIMKRLVYSVEDYMCPGYTAITLADQNDQDKKYYKGNEIRDCGVFINLKNAAVFNEFSASLTKEYPEMLLRKNSELVALYGGTGKGLSLFVNGFIILLISLILFGSISLVYNSFSISINERTKQIGILKSVGATKKQIRKTVFYEALFDCITAVPAGILLGCSGIGITFWLLQNAFRIFLENTMGLESEYVKIKIIVSVPLLFLAVFIVVAATILSAAIPAYRASKVSPIDLVRQVPDIKMPKRSMLSSRILTKLFGAEGMLAAKNYSRNRKRYRATIISLAVSVILFITASSFVSYLGKANEMEFDMGNVSLIYYDYYNGSDEDKESPQYTGRMKGLFESVDSVNKVIAARFMYSSVDVKPLDQEDITYKDNAHEYLADTDESDPVPATDLSYVDDYYSGSNIVEVIYIDDESFNTILEEENIDNSRLAENDLNAIVYNSGSYYMLDNDYNRVKHEYRFIEEDEIPKKYKMIWYDEFGYDENRTPITQVLSKDKEVYCALMENEYVDAYYAIIDAEDRYELAELQLSEILNKRLYGEDWSGEDDLITDNTTSFSEKDLLILEKMIFVKMEDMYNEKELNIVGTTYNKNYCFSDSAVVILPFSAAESIRTDTMNLADYFIFSDDPIKAEADLNRLLIDNHMDTSGLYNYGKEVDGKRKIGTIVSVFSYGFIVLISLVSIANVFNTISTNVALRRKEFGMLKSMGMSNKGVSKMLNIECLIYGFKSLLLGLPLAFPITYLVYKITSRAFEVPFSIPWYSIIISIASVFVVVFITMFYAYSKIKRDNTIDALRNDNV